MKGYNGFINQNVAIDGTKRIVVTKDNVKVGRISLKTLSRPQTGTLLYKFGCLADIHIFINSSYTDDTTANSDYVKAIRFFRDDKCNFTCICGDFTGYGTWYNQSTYGNELENYQTLTNNNRGDMEVYASAGNHEHWWRCDVENITLEEFSRHMETYTGKPLYYSFTQGNDVFIMCGCVSNNEAFDRAELQWLYETLEANRNKRCFLFVHPFIKGSQFSGDCTELYSFNMLGGDYGTVFINLLSHYHNVIYFHGHSHELFEMQEYTQSLATQPPCTYDYTLGCHSIHIPSLAIPMDITSGERVRVNSGSQGYVVEVYENHILLKGRDFVNDKWVPIGTYCIQTTLQEIEANTFVDSTGTITTN